MFYTTYIMEQTSFWKFIDENGTFVADNPQQISWLYFPLANEVGMMSSITPDLKGDIKTDNNSFLMQPVSRIDLLYGQLSRNFWIQSKKGIWSIVDNAKNDNVSLRAGLLYHSITKTNKKLGIKATITNFIPADNACVELMLIEIENISNTTIEITSTSAIPVFGRSADNVRDHRHVTSLLNRIQQDKYGVIVKPVMSFDERGHTKNGILYYVLGIDGNNHAPAGSFPTIELFFGEGGTPSYPKAIFENMPVRKCGPSELSGKEAIGALRFKTKILKPNERTSFGLLLGIAETTGDLNKTFARYNSIQKIRTALQENKSFWQNERKKLTLSTGNPTYDNWLAWVGVQPTLRKIFGCSFLPDFDYGRGGKGWRDLWQDCLALLLTNSSDVRRLIKANFGGVRIDGTNATIITKQPGAFLSDRNKISRVWMDHGVWPYFTVELYINQTGDFSILLEKATYFRDAQLMRAKEINATWNGSGKLKTKKGATYQGSILEHVLIQHLVQFFNVGAHNSIRLENADWNDGLDMAFEKGESVAFSAFYGYNLRRIAALLAQLQKIKKIQRVSLLKETVTLLDSLNQPINYDSVTQKTKLLEHYLQSTKYAVSGKCVTITINTLIGDLQRKANWLLSHIQKKEWIAIDKNIGFFNGYYDNTSRRVEGKFDSTIRMTLTGQVFPILSGAASEGQIKKIVTAARKYLQDKQLKGFRLNTNFGGPQFDIGRAFAFSYGDKENGAIFSHMCVMFAYGLYARGFAKEGFEVLNSLFELAANSAASKIYPNLPEYFNLEGRGMYSYLTGSASWYIMTLLTQAFGVRGEYGDLVIEPKLVQEQFKDSPHVSVGCSFAEKKLSIYYQNPRSIDYPAYTMKNIKSPCSFVRLNDKKILIKRKTLASFASRHIPITIILG